MTSAKRMRNLQHGAALCLKILLGLLFIAPIFVCVIYSVQPESNVMRLQVTTDFTLEHFQYVFTHLSIFSYLKNSFITCGIAIACQIVFASFAAYAFAFFDFKGKGILFVLVQATMMIPAEVVIITNYSTIQNIGMNNTLFALAAPNLINGMSIFLMRQYYLTIPKDLKEASVIDGCSDMRFLFKIAIPLSVPTIASLATYQFILIYNQYFWPLLVTNTDAMRTVQVGISMLIYTEIVEYGRLLAGAALSIVPALIVFIFGQDYIVKGMMAGAVKG